MNFFDQLSNRGIKLNPTEERIVNYLLEHYGILQDLKIAKVAEELYLSPNSIVRLCKKLGYHGFSELKYQMIHERRQYGIEAAEQQTNVMDSLKQTLAINSRQNIEKTARLIYDSRQVIFFALGLSRIVALDLAKKLEHLNKIIIVPDDRDNCILYANNLAPGQIAFFISYSGSTDIICKLSYIAQTRGVPIVTLTGMSQNPISGSSVVSLYAYFRKMNYRDADITSRIGFYLVTELILEEYMKLFRLEQQLEDEID
ncbi:MAG: MurR/RpiR family transcriptional regulator [Lacrimispora sphenoides]